MVLLASFFSMETDMKKDLVEHINAAFSGIWIQTHQADEAEAEIRTLPRSRAGNWLFGTLLTVSGPVPEPRVSQPVIRWAA